MLKLPVKSPIVNGDIDLSEYAKKSDVDAIDASLDNKANKKEVEKISSQLDTKASKNEVFSMANMGQDIKEAIVQGGQNVAVVGENAILRENIVNGEVTFRKLNNNIQNSFNFEYEDIAVTFTANGYWDYSTGNIAPSDYISYSKEIAVRPGDEFKIRGCASYRANLYLIKDSEGNILSVFPNTNVSSTQYKDIIFTIPNKGVKLCINSISTFPTQLEKLNKVTVNGEKIKFADNSINRDKLDNKLATLFNEIYADKTVNWTNGSYYRWNSLEIVEDSNASRVVLNVNEGDKYEITGTSYWEANLYYITDKYNNIIETYPNKNETSTNYTKRVIIPKNGSKLYINQRNTSPTIVKVVGSYKLKTNDLNKKWVAFGDSLTDSRTLNGGKNYVDYVTENLGLATTNLGKAGTGYLNGNGGTQQFYNRTSSIPADTDVLTVFGSFNDLFVTNLTIGSITDTSINTLYGAINTFLKNCWSINPSMIIGIISPTPWDSCWRGGARATKAVEYVNALKNVAEYYSLPYLDLFNSSNLRPWDANIKQLYYNNADGVHPNTLGHKKYIAPKVENFIKSIVAND